MKKWIACLLVLAMAIPLFTITGSAEDENFIPETSATFESGKVGDWKVLTNGTLEIVDNPDGDGKVLAYKLDEDDPKTWASPQLNVFPYIKEHLTGEAELRIMFDVYCPDDDINFVVRIRTNEASDYSKCEEDGEKYCMLGAKKGTSCEWITMTVTMPVTDDDLTKKDVAWNLCFDGISRFCDSELYFDNFYIGLEPEVEHEPIPEKTPVETGTALGVGTIRWDAFTESTLMGTDPASQVARVLSPARYHGQAPFFANIAENGMVSFPAYTVKSWEAEARYAVAYGLDYFAYLWYETTDAMSQPRKFHLKSTQKDTIKMTGILETLRSEQTMKELYDAMKDSCWLRVSGRPVVFLYAITKYTVAELTKMVATLRQGAADAGVQGSLYVVGMGGAKDLGAVNGYKKADVDALSWYGFGASLKDAPYTMLAETAESTVSEMMTYCRALKMDLIPAFTAGYDSRARIQTGVSWVKGDPNASEDKDKPYANRYTLPPQEGELQKHIENILKLTEENKDVCVTQLVCSYAWNEHDEGGWLCPTLAVDENGKQLYNEDGSKKINVERLEALAAARGMTVNGTPVPPDDTLATATAIPKNTPGASDATPVPADAGISPWVIILPVAAVVVAAAVVAVVVILKKKKKQ